MADFDVYVGDGEVRGAAAQKLDAQPPKLRQSGRYLAAPELAEAVNIAVALGQPLLVTGEPGCGKTDLAFSVARELDLEPALVFWTRSTSRAQDLLYRFDAVLRFYDVQRGSPRAEKPEEYIHWAALGEAIRSQDRRRVVLIDEIDKAPRDFPNDLLNELDKMEFSVPELDREAEGPAGQGRQAVSYKAKFRPVVIITSNSERQLPLPFLRRCVFHHITFPDREMLTKIGRERLGELKIPPDLLDAAVDKFLEVRKVPTVVKKPATGELLAWVQALARRGLSATDLRARKVSALPLWQALIKDREDWLRLQQA
jgi:MoxR-like ATPase